MEEYFVGPALVTTVIASLVTHVFFKHFDPVDLLTSITILTITPVLLIYHFSSNGSEFFDLLWIIPLFDFALIFFIAAYRVSPFHPLAQYPGPIMLKLTKLYSVWIAYRGKYHVYLKGWHDRYGPTVRIGPNELSTVEKDLIPQILGSQGMPKGPLWDGRRFAQGGNPDYDSVVDVRDLSIHSQLRKPWNKALGVGPLKDYEALLVLRVAELRDRLKEICSERRDRVGRVDMAQWITYFSYDFMGDLAFAGSFHYMKEGPKDGGMESMNSAMYLLSMTQHANWIAKFIRSTPILNKGIKYFTAYGVDHGIKRAGNEIKQKDLFYHMTLAEEVTGPDSLPLIISNSLLAIVAGSDTSASVMSNVVYLLMRHPEKHKKLQHEIDIAFKEHQILELDPSRLYNDILTKMPYLNAVINEALRLFPAVPTSIQRGPAKGSHFKLLQADNISILLQEGNGILVPPYAIHRDPRYFSPSPDEFIPERWLPSSTTGTIVEYITTRDAFIPFSTGPANCAGRTLALMELRYAVVTLSHHFEMEFDLPDFDPSSWERNLEDRFTFAKGCLRTKIRWRHNITTSASMSDPY